MDHVAASERSRPAADLAASILQSLAEGLEGGRGGGGGESDSRIVRASSTLVGRLGGWRTRGNEELPAGIRTCQERLVEVLLSRVGEGQVAGGVEVEGDVAWGLVKGGDLQLVKYGK